MTVSSSPRICTIQLSHFVVVTGNPLATFDEPHASQHSNINDCIIQLHLLCPTVCILQTLTQACPNILHMMMSSDNFSACDQLMPLSLVLSTIALSLLSFFCCFSQLPYGNSNQNLRNHGLYYPLSATRKT